MSCLRSTKHLITRGPPRSDHQNSMVSSARRQQDPVFSSLVLGQPLPIHHYGNISWNQDGQGLVIAGRKAFIVTPHPPSSLPIQQAIQSQVDTGSDGEDTVDNKAPTLSQQVALFSTFIEVPGSLIHMSQGSRIGTSAEHDYWDQLVARCGNGMNPLPGESEGSMVTYERNKYYRAGTWSPLGLSRMGGCLVVLLSNDLEVVVYEAERDHLRGRYQVVCSLSRMMADTLLKRTNPSKSGTNCSAKGKAKAKAEDTCKPPAIADVLTTRFQAIAWSDHVSALPGAPGLPSVDGSLLAIGNRAGGISLWEHEATGQRMRMLQHEIMCSSWVVELAWSPWKRTSDTEFSAELAFVSSSHEVFTTTVRREANASQDGWELRWSLPSVVDSESDKRSVTAIKFMHDCLVWTKPGTVHIRSPYFENVRELRLQRVGDWAGCNSLERCVGIQSLGSTTLLIVLASLTYHVINNFTTAPTLAPPIESLSATKIARKAMMARRVMQLRPAPDRSITSSTGAWAMLDDWSGVACWVSEPMEFHDLSYRSEKERNAVFCLVDQQADLSRGDGRSLDDRIRQTLNDPPSCLTTAPNKVIFPWILNILHSVDPEAATSAMLAICKENGQGPVNAAVGSNLANALFSDGAVNRWRLQLVMARWCATRGDNVAVADELETRISRWCMNRILGWLGEQIASRGQVTAGALDRTFLAVQNERNGSAALPASLRVALGDCAPVEPCPACAAPVALSGPLAREGVCDNGHLWGRCSVTQLLLTSHIVRVCSMCSARSLVPPASADSSWMVEAVLRGAKCCVSCGGRWIESA